MKFVRANRMQESVSIGISLPRTVIERIDIVRGDVPRSKFVYRILESAIEKQEPPGGRA
jgi:metal-responsive CopG/Arc/MetJ family transcriptional regulator